MRALAPWWAGYALLAVASTWSFLYLALLLAAHGVTVLLVVLRERRSRAALAALGWFAGAGVVAAAGTVPVALLSARGSAAPGRCAAWG